MRKCVLFACIYEIVYCLQEYMRRCVYYLLGYLRMCV